jgi:GH25 family lysozyme M1 (1,4-beta-N-acetylmuramidase)
MESRNPSNLKGIDMSSNQGVVDFVKIKNAGIQIVYIKATEGISYLNPLLIDSYNKAVAAGLKVGFYHFFRAHNNDTENAKQQAQYFYDAIKNYHCDCRLALDIETTEGIQSKDVISSLAKTFLDQLRVLSNKDVVLYTYAYFAQTNLTNILAGYPLWIAHYGVNTPNGNSIWNNWIGFQYDNKGSVDGVSTVVDLNEFTNDILLPVPVSEPISQPASTSTIPVGSKVKVSTTVQKYATGENIANFVKGSVYTVIQSETDRVLLDGIMSWVKVSDVTVVGSTPQPIPQPAPAPVVSTIKVGSKVKMTGKKYATGQNIPFWAKLRTYDVLQVKTTMILVGVGKAITGWIWSSECKKL